MLPIRCIFHHSSFKVIGLPGHTKGSIGLDVAEKYLFVGDELDNWLVPGIGHLYHDPETLRTSAEKVRSLGDRIICYKCAAKNPRACVWDESRFSFT